MKFDDMPFGKHMELLEQIKPHVDAILADEAFQEIRENIKPDTEVFLANAEVRSFLLKEHKEDVYAIVASVHDIKPEEIDTLPYREVKRMIEDTFTGDVIGLFPSLMRLALSL